MASSQIVKVVIEVELIDDGDAPVTHTLTSKHSVAEMEASKRHEQAMLTALRSDATIYAQFVRNTILGSIEALGIHNEIGGLAQVRCSFSANVALLETLVPRLPADAQQYYQQAAQEGWLSDGTELVFDTIKATPLTLAVEYGIDQV